MYYFPAAGGSGTVTGKPIPNADTTVLASEGNIRVQTKQTDNRIHRLSSTNALAGNWIEIQKGNDAFTLTIIDDTDSSTIVTFAAGASRNVRFMYDGFFWGIN